MNSNLKIQVLGSGCSTCKKLFELTKQAIQELEIKAEVEYVTDIQKIIELGVMQSPVLTIKGIPVIVGSLPKIEEIKEVIAANIPLVLIDDDCCSDKNTCDIKCKPDDDDNNINCSCGGRC